MAFTITYELPATGLVAPTALQVKEQVTFTVATIDADTVEVIPVNMGMSVADLAAGFPIVTLEPLYATAGTEARLANWLVTAKAANSVSLTKVAAGGSGTGAGATVRVHVRRPHSIGR